MTPVRQYESANVSQAIQIRSSRAVFVKAYIRTVVHSYALTFCS